MLRAAMKLVGERGYRGTSLAAIGEEAGYSRGLVSERFGSKDGLLWALVKRIVGVWRRDVDATSEGREAGVPELHVILDKHREALLRYEGLRAFYALMFEAIGPVPQLLPEFRQLHARFREDLVAILERGIAAGVVRSDIHPEAQAVVLLGALRGIAFQWLMERDGFSLDAAYFELKRNLERSLMS